MNTEQLILSLAETVPSVPRGALGRRVALGLAGGAVATMILVAGMLGVRPDLMLAVHGFPFWMKWSYTASLGLGAALAVGALARPVPRSPRPLWLFAIPLTALTAVGAGELASEPVRDWLPMWLGHSWKACPLLILGLAAPVFWGLLWAFRRLAPTRLRAAGAAAGLAAGSWAAFVYCLHCPETSAIFVLTWYNLGILAATAIGAMLGPVALRW